MGEDVEEKYSNELLSLKINSKPLINSLTMMAEDFIQSAPIIVRTIEKHLARIRPESKLPVLYLIDSIVKNVKKEYVDLFSQNIVSTFCSVFESDPSVRVLLHKLRLTWVDVFPLKKLMAIDLRCSDIDDDYPIGHRSAYGGSNSNPANTIHVNPKFLNSGQLRNTNLLSLSADLSSLSAEPSTAQDLEMKKQLILKQKQLIELQEKKLELELLEKKFNMEEQTRKKKQQDDEANAKLLAQAELAKQKTQAATSIMARANAAPTQSPPKDVGETSTVNHTVKPAAVPEAYQVPRNPPDPAADRVSRNPDVFPSDPRIRRNVIILQQQPPVQVRRITPWNSETNQRVPRNPGGILTIPTPLTMNHAVSLRSPPPAPKLNLRNDDNEETDRKPRLSIDSPFILSARGSNSPSQTTDFAGIRRSESKSPKHELNTSTVVGRTREGSRDSQEIGIGKRSGFEEKSSPRRVQTPNRFEKDRSERKGSRASSKSSSGSRKSTASEKDLFVPITSGKDTKSKSPDRFRKSGNEKRRNENDRDREKTNRSSSSAQSSPPLKKSKGARNAPSGRSTPRDTKSPKTISDISFDSTSTTTSSYSNNGVRRGRDKEGSSNQSKDKDGKKSRRMKDQRKSSFEANDTKGRNESRKAEREKKREDDREEFKSRTTAVLSRNYRKRSGVPEFDGLDEVKQFETTDIDRRFEPKGEQDVDLRKSSVYSGVDSGDKAEPPSAKKSRNSTLIDNLFGREDVDLRPSSSSWSQVKVKKPNEDGRRDSVQGAESEGTSDEQLKDMLRDGKQRPPPALSPASSVGSIAPSTCDPLGRPLAFARLPDDPEERRRSLGTRSASVDPVESFRMRYIETPMRIKGILDPSDLEIALSRSKEEMDQGTFNSAQFNIISKELVQLNEGIKIRQVQEMDTKSRTGSTHMPSPWNPDANPVWAALGPGFPRPTPPIAMVRPEQPMWPRGVPHGLPRGPNPFTEPINPNPMGQMLIPVVNQRELTILEQDIDGTTPLDKIPRQVRFYGTTAIVFIGKLSDEPKEISFIPEESMRTLFINGEPLKIRWGITRKFYYAKKSHSIRIGAPTRELYIDGIGYEVYFGAVDARVRVDNNWVRFRLAGPPPGVKIGTVFRYDLVAGRTTVFVDGNPYSLYLDEKPQIMDFCGFPVIAQFCDEFRSITFNGVVFPTMFGGPPRPVILPNGRRLYIRFNAISPLTEQNIMGHLHARNQHIGQGPAGSRPRDVVPFSAGFNPNASQGFPHLPVQELPNSTNPLDMVANLLTPSNNTKEHGVLDNSYEIESSNSNENVPQSTSEEELSSSGPLNVQDLLSKLLLAGLLPTANKTKEEESNKAQNQPKDSPREPQKIREAAKPSNSVEEVKMEHIPPPVAVLEAVNVTFSDNLRTRIPKVVDSLYLGVQCGSCGLRFPADQNHRYTQHLDWHFRLNRREKANARKALSRKWYYDLSDWIQFEDVEELEERAIGGFETQEADMEEDKAGSARLLDPDSYTVLAAGFECVSCPQCGEGFETFYDEEKEEWRLRDAVHPTNPTEPVTDEKKLFHPICHQDYLNFLVEEEEPKPEPAPDADDEVLILREGPKEVVLAEVDIAEDDEKVKEDKLEMVSETIVDDDPKSGADTESITVTPNKGNTSYVVLSPVVIDVMEDENSNIPGIALSDGVEGNVFGFALNSNSSHAVTTPVDAEKSRAIVYEAMKFDFPKIKQEPIEWQDISQDQIIMSNLFPHKSPGAEPVDITLDDDDSGIDAHPSSSLDTPINSQTFPVILHDIDLTEDDSELAAVGQQPVAEIDGNVHFRVTEVVKQGSAKIKINIFGLDTSQSPTHKGSGTGEDSQGVAEILKVPPSVPNPNPEKSQSPTPPDLESLFKSEEIRRLKPKLAMAGKKFINNPVKRTGREESGLCSII